jgi:hypothetical protein
MIDYAFMLKVYLELINMQITSPRVNFLAESSLEAIKQIVLPQRKKEYEQSLNRSVRNLLTTDLNKSACFSCMPESDYTVRILDRN